MSNSDPQPMTSWEQVETIAAEMDPRFAAIPIVLVGTGLRPEELWALERRDLDLDAGVLSVERVFTQGVLKDCRKSSQQRRRLPVRTRVIEALKDRPARIDSPLVFPAARGGHIDGEKFRYRSGHLPFVQRGSTIVVCTTRGTRSRAGRLPGACNCSTWPGSWALRCR